MTNKVLLLGAGFSRNWGGWLATEVFSDLLLRKQIKSDLALKQLLLDHQRKQGFESALDELQHRWARTRSPSDKAQLDGLQAGIVEMFMDMNRAFVDTGTFHFEFQNDARHTVTRFLASFDAIFTLNQDILLERNYLRMNVQAYSNRWSDASMPAMQELPDPGMPFPKDWLRARWRPIEADIRQPLKPRMQPYIKLHGSASWVEANNAPILVMGGYKAQAIGANKLLQWYQDLLVEYLGRSDTRLVVIGYGFGDNHITNAIRAAGTSGLRMYLIDPLGIEVINPNRAAPIQGPRDHALYDLVGGESKRPLREIFGGSGPGLGQLESFLNG